MKYQRNVQEKKTEYPRPRVPRAAAELAQRDKEWRALVEALGGRDTEWRALVEALGESESLPRRQPWAGEGWGREPGV